MAFTTDLTTSELVLRAAKFNSADEVGGDDYVNDAIDEATEEVTNDFRPTFRSYFFIDSTQTKYEFRKDIRSVYRIDKVYIRDNNNNRIEYTSGTASESNLEYTEDLVENTITFASATVTARSGFRVEVLYVPNSIHKLVTLKAALYLIELSSSVNAEDNLPMNMSRMMTRINRLTNAISVFTAEGSSNNANYDPTYGEYITQTRFYTYNS